MALIDSVQSTLESTFGFSGFREGQGQTIQQLLSGQSSLAIFPTGSGKSLCYQLTALHLPHLTIVVMPLLALIKDQLTFLNSKGIPAASIDSTINAEQQTQIKENIRAGKVKILMVSVERFKNERFRDFIESIDISMLVVDEAHCISEWGHNFRPDYLKLPLYRTSLNIPLVLLLTATSTKKVKLDMASKFNIQPEHIIQTGFYRDNLELNVLPVEEQAKNTELLTALSQLQGSGIIYVTLQNTADRVAEWLRKHNIHAQSYHAGLATQDREQIQHQFMTGYTPIIVATIAFGMGIDKSDIRFVIHYDLPKSIENYSQEIGRAGRDGLKSTCLVMGNLDGLNTVENFVYGDTPEPSGIRALIDNIKNDSVKGLWETQISPLSKLVNIRELPLKTLLVQLELRNAITPLHAYFANIRIKFIEDSARILSRFDGERQSFLRDIFSVIEMKKIWGTLDVDQLNQRYGYERSRVMLALEYLHEKELIELETKSMTDVFKVNMEQLNDTGLVFELSHYFEQTELSEIKRIGALIRFFELEHCLAFNLARYFDDYNAPQNCGHCSVCNGKVARLTRSVQDEWPSAKELTQNLIEFFHLIHKISSVEPTIIMATRFLAGLTVPAFGRTGVRQLEGFGKLASFRYSDIRDRVTPIWQQITAL